MSDTENMAIAKVDSMVANIYQKYMSPTDDPRAAIANMAERILDAETFEEMFSSSNVEPNADLFDKGLAIDAINFNSSDYQAGLPFYATFRGKKIEDGSDFITNCGAWQTVVIAYKLLENDWLPRNLMFHRNESPTRAGYHPVNLLPWEEPF